MSTPAARCFVQVVEYNPKWPDRFCQIRDRIWPSVRDIAVAIEHVGSTAVPGLAAKPIIDLDIVIRSRTDLPAMVTQLRALGYEHRGDLGIDDREAFQTSQNQPAHNLYVCLRGSIALSNHVTLRDHLRLHPSDVVAYSSLKRQLAEQYRGNIDHYVQGKTEFILSILAQHGFGADRLDSIRKANQQ